MRFILNIGLHSDTLGNLTAQFALDQVNAAGIFVYGSQVFESDTEPTLVVTAKYRSTPSQVRMLVGYRQVLTQLARDLGQDCIAAWLPDDNRGELLGPRPWGDFDGRFFLTPDGQRLVEEPVTA